MIFKRFRNSAIFYIVMIVVLSLTGLYVLIETYFWLTSLWIFIIDLIVIVWFLKFIEREYRKLSHFLFSIDQEDFTPPYSKSFEDIDFNSAFDRLSEVIRSLRDEAQVNYQYLHTIINQINVAIVCIDKNEKITIANLKANNLFTKRVLRDINSLSISNDNLPFILKNIQPSEKKLVKFKLDGELFNFSIQVSEFKMQTEYFKLFSFQNVQSEIEQNELASWQKLTRVISHEIMNSVIPISNLSEMVHKQLFDKSGKFVKDIDIKIKEDIKEELQTIENRSKSLVKFVEATRNFTKMPKPELENIQIKSLLNRIVSLLKTKLNDLNIEINLDIESNQLNILADKSMIEQVLINIMLNSIDALNGKLNARIDVVAYRNIENRTHISFSDNGKGIPNDQLDNIFVPFYTTKKNGSGIGLSISKQIMFMHKGNLTVKSWVGEGTTFLISF